MNAHADDDRLVALAQRASRATGDRRVDLLAELVEAAAAEIRRFRPRPSLGGPEDRGGLYRPNAAMRDTGSQP